LTVENVDKVPVLSDKDTATKLEVLETQDNANNTDTLKASIYIHVYSYDIAFKIQVRAYDLKDKLYSLSVLDTSTAYAFCHYNPTFTLLPISINAEKRAEVLIRFIDLGFIKPIDTI
jgi:hypothetical protein